MAWYKLHKGTGAALEALINQEYFAANPQTEGVVTAYTHCIQMDNFDYIIQTEITQKYITDYVELVDTIPIPEEIDEQH